MIFNVTILSLFVIFINTLPSAPIVYIKKQNTVNTQEEETVLVALAETESIGDMVWAGRENGYGRTQTHIYKKY